MKVLDRQFGDGGDFLYGMVVDPLAAPCLGETGPGKRKGQSPRGRRDISDAPASIWCAPPPGVNPYHECLSHITVIVGSGSSWRRWRLSGCTKSRAAAGQHGSGGVSLLLSAAAAHSGSGSLRGGQGPELRHHGMAAAASSCLTTLLRAVRILDSFHLRRRQHLIMWFLLLVMQNMTLCDHSWYNTVWRRPPPRSLRGARVVEASTPRVALQQPRSQQGPLPKGGDSTRGRHIRNGLHQSGPRAPPLAGGHRQPTTMP